MSRPAASPLDVEAISTRYFAAWEQQDPDRIAALHTEDTRFCVHNGAEPAIGRGAAREAFALLFEQLPEFGFDVHRVLCGPDFWVLDWTVTATIAGTPIRFDAVDVVMVSADGLVSQKDTFIDAAQLDAALRAAT